MTEIDDAIRAAMSAEDADMLERYRSDQTLTAQVLGTLGGEFRWLNRGGWIAGFVLFGLGAACAWRFVRSDDLQAMILWGAGLALATVGLAMIKVWFWMELHHNRTMRELKRLELQIARLAARSA